MKWFSRVTVGLIVIHALGFFAWSYWSWEGFVLFLSLYAITAMGVTVGYHRYLTHGGFQTYRPVRWLLSVVGLLSAEGPPIEWVATHRKHHLCSDQEGDPHTPNDGFWHSHVLWLLPRMPTQEAQDLYHKHARDLVRDGFLRFLNRSYPFWHAGLAIVLAIAGYLYGGWYYCTSFVFYGCFLRMVCVLHATWSVNSVSHLWGYRNYPTDDRSRNNWIVALLTFGEGWHNNHHKYPTLARHGHRWWEIDVSYWMIRFLKLIRLVWDVKDRVPT